MQETSLSLEPRRNPITVVWRNALFQAFLNDRITLISGAFIMTIVVVVILAPLTAPHEPEEQQLDLRHLPPFSSGVAIVKDTAARDVLEERYFLLGTDHLGRDLVSRLIYGGRISIAVGFLGVVVSGTIGVFLGMVAGYYKGIVDDVVMRAVDVFMSVPLLFLALMVIFVLGPSFKNIIIVFAVARWMLYCRITRGVVMSLREQSFIDAAHAIGCSDWRILSRHMLPNLFTPILTLAALDVPANILTESALSFLGLGIQPPESSWGLMLSSGREYITSAWWIIVVPGVAIFLTALSFNLFGVWMRAVGGPLQRWRWLKATKEAKEAGISG